MDINSIINHALEQAKLDRPDLNQELTNPRIRSILIEAYNYPATLAQFSDDLYLTSIQSGTPLQNPLVYLAALAIASAVGITVYGDVDISLEKIISLQDIIDIDININNINPGNPVQSKELNSCYIPVFKPILFDLGKSDIKSIEVNKVQLLATCLINHPDRKVKLTGYTDRNHGEGDKADPILSLSRAKNVKLQLISYGVKESQIETIGAGYNHPEMNENREENETLSRRVTISIY